MKDIMLLLRQRKGLYLSLLGIVESAQQFDKSGFAAAILTHDSQALANLKFHTYILQRPILTSRILEGDILKLHFILPVSTLFRSQTSLIHRIRNV